MIQNFFNFNSNFEIEIVRSLENELVIENLINLSNKLSIIVGSSKSGKTTLARFYSEKANIPIISNEADLKFNKNIDKYFIDTDILKFNQEILFHFIQNILTYNCSLYIFSPNDIEDFSFKFDDLKSRLSLFTKFVILEPKEELMIILLKKYLKQKSIKIDNSIIIEIPKFIERSYLSVFNCANDINHLLYENNHNINLRLIKEFYNAI
jgi:chromosomal replication initiation ATPase DnaA|tara:strand:- start:230 stop:856 length:627 start_codon:yes stop_codon:yes gene_type:complete